MRLIYTSLVVLYTLAVRLATPFNTKARQWYYGRNETPGKIAGFLPDDKQWLWFHAASLGEFEQGRTVIEAIRQSRPDYLILLTFYSPSGYEIRKNYEHANLVLYLPHDTPKQINNFIKHFNIRAVFFIKYEFWYNLLFTLHQRNIPFYFFSVRFRPGQYFFRWYGRWFLNQLRPAQHIFVQDEASLVLLKNAGFSKCSIAGDTRFDRVAQLARDAAGLPEIEAFVGNSPLFVAGSTWPSDENLLLPSLDVLPVNYKIIIAPHDISSGHVNSLMRACHQPAVRYSDIKTNPGARILVIDNIGLLSRIYRYASLAYIGGGFGKAIHNIQEPIAWGCPVIIGPQHQKFTEANDLISLGGAFAVHNKSQLVEILKKLSGNQAFRSNASSICLDYVKRNLGATDQIVSILNI